MKYSYRIKIAFACIASGVGRAPLSSQVPQPSRPADSVTIRIVNMDLRTAVQMMQQYIDQPVLFSGQGTAPVSLETPRPVPRGDVILLLRALLEGQNFELTSDTVSKLYRARQRTNAPQPGAIPQLGAPPARPQAAATELFVIPLKHARAAGVATTINSLYGRESYAVGANGRPQTLADELRQSQIPPVGAPSPQVPASPPARSAAFSGEVTIVPDPRANSLLVRANRTDFELIQAAVEQIDVRPLQALIEVLVVEVERDRSLSLGIDASLAATTVGHNGASINGGVTGPSPGLGDFALSVMQLGGFNLDATLRAAAQLGDVHIINRPVVLTANNEQASIIVGSQRPFVQLSRTLPTDNGSQDQVVEYKDVGTKLTVRPTISIDGSVELEVTQEVSNATTETAFNAPVISTRSVQTQLLVHDGQTVVLGGLTGQEKDIAQSGIPILSSIPFLGALFGQVSRSTTETELFIFLTPHVIRTDDDAARLSDPLKARAGSIKP
jgi:general secretion pathway protein D